MTAQRKTFRLQIKRLCNSNDPNKAVYVPHLTNERIVIEFQAEANTTPIIGKLEEIEVHIDPNQPTAAQEHAPTTENLYRQFGSTKIC